MEHYKGYRISKGAKNRWGKQTFLAVLGNVALMDDKEETLYTRIDARERYDAWVARKK